MLFHFNSLRRKFATLRINEIFHGNNELQRA